MTTPIEEARNVGPVTAKELRAVGIDTVEKLKGMGWEAAFEAIVLAFPQRLNVNMAVGLIGVVEGCHWQEVPAAMKAEARELVRALKATR
jgi:predicted dinucleotide-utilizing enzyme